VVTSVGVEVTGLGKRFAERRPWSAIVRAPFERRWYEALHDVSLRIAPGEFFGLLGPNGAGKTTLFRILSTLIVPDCGDAQIGGASVRTAPAAVRRLVSPVPADERSLAWRLDARENLRLFGVLHGLSTREADARASELLALVGLEQTGVRLVGAFSSGMRQRLLVARALMGTPRVLLLDEPTRSLDPVSARDLRAFLRDKLSRRLGCTILLATHSHEEAFDCCDRVAVLHRGRVVAAGPRVELVEALGNDRYRLEARGAASVLTGLAARGLIRDIVARDGSADWERWEFGVHEPGLQAPAVVEALVGAGAAVGAFARVEPTLAELIEQYVARARAPETAHA
jgi:ABC-2 type transport system ATP-binding protein